MTITREQVADLRVGDVVEVVRRERFTIAEVTADGRAYPWIGDGVGSGFESLTVISRAPRPFYDNHVRTKPVRGDVVRIEDKRDVDDSYTDIYWPVDGGNPWLDIQTGERFPTDLAIPTGGIRQHYTVRLLVDGETGEVVQ